jgi:hypothetical protein
MKALLGYALLFMAIGLIIAYFACGAIRFFLIVVFMLLAYFLLCVC